MVRQGQCRWETIQSVGQNSPNLIIDKSQLFFRRSLFTCSFYTQSRSAGFCDSLKHEESRPLATGAALKLLR